MGVLRELLLGDHATADLPDVQGLGSDLLISRHAQFLGLPVSSRRSVHSSLKYSSFLKKAWCNTLSCPRGMELKNTAWSTKCIGTVCTEDDVRTCCEDPPDSEGKKNLKSTGLAGQQDAGDLDQEALGGFPFPDKYAQLGIDPAEPGAMLRLKAALPRPCDPLGRITRSPDGYWCGGRDSCVTVMPFDFASRVPRGVAPVPADVAGRPWCVAPEDLKAYGGPIEVRCNASGHEAKDEVGHPSGCWWLRKVTLDQEPLQRLTGPIVGRHAPPPGQTHEEGYIYDGVGLTDEEAEHWVQTGELSKGDVSEA